MPQLSRRGVLAIAVVVDIAVYSDYAPVAASEITERLNLPPRHIEPLLQQLTRQGVLHGQRGPGGGYKVPNSLVTCRQIMEAVAETGSDDVAVASTGINALVVPAVKRAEALYLAELEKVTVADICARALATRPRRA